MGGVREKGEIGGGGGRAEVEGEEGEKWEGVRRT